jgi:proline iminopeptidase
MISVLVDGDGEAAASVKTAVINPRANAWRAVPVTYSLSRSPRPPRTVVSDSPAIQRFTAFRRSLGRPQQLHRLTVSARGLQFAVFTTDDPGLGTLPLVCVNGGLLFDHKLLWPALSPLAARRQLIFYDQRGRGQSSVPPSARSSRIEFDAGDLPAIRSALGIDEWHVLGHSWGGGVAMLSTTHDSDSIRSLTLLNAVGLTGDWLADLPRRAFERLTGPARERLLVAELAVRPDAPSAADPAALSEFAAAIYPAWFANAELATLFTPPRSTSVTGAAVSARLRRESYDWRGTVGPLTMPALLLHGDADLLPMAMAEATRHALGSRATLVRVPNSGHNPFWEEPSIVFPAIDAFLDASDRA